MFERLGNKWDGFGFELDENVKNKITVDLENLSKDILKEDQNISTKDLEEKINNTLKENKNTPDYSKKKIFKDHFDDKMQEILNNQKNYLDEENKKKRDEEYKK